MEACLRATSDLVVNSLLALRRTHEGLSAPSRRALYAFDVFLVVAILWTAFAPASGGVTPPTAGAYAAAIEIHGTPALAWSNATSPRRHLRLNEDDDDGGGRRRKKHKKHKKGGGKKFRAKFASDNNELSDDGVTPNVSAEEVSAATGGDAEDDDAGSKHNDLSDSGARALSPSCAKVAAATCKSAVGGPPKRVVVTLSIGKRSHFSVTRVPMLAYAQRANAELVVVDSYAHPCLAQWNSTLRAGSNSHFMKLPLLQYFLTHYDQVMFLDDDVLLSPHAPDLFDQVPCDAVGAIVEGYHKPGWHAMHGRSYCELYGLASSHPELCGSPAATKKIRIFNSGVMVLSKAHL